MVDREYVVDSQPVVGSERDVSRLRVVPIANHHDSHMVNANKHATVLMGGGFAFLAHMDTMQLLCLEVDHTNEDPDYLPTPCMVPTADGTGGLDKIGDCWWALALGGAPARKTFTTAAC